MSSSRIASIAFAAFLLASPASTQTVPAVQTPQACPIQITNINPSGDDSFGHAFVHNTGHAHDNDGHMFVLKAKNVSGKNIRGMKFQAAYFDATEDTTDIPVSWEWTDPLNADAEKSFRWENAWRNESKVGWRVRLMKVLFDDGTKWEPTAQGACSADYWRDKHHKS